MYSQFVSNISSVTRISRSFILKKFPSSQTQSRTYRSITRRFIKLTINPKKKSGSKLNVKSESDIHLGAKNHIKEEEKDWLKGFNKAETEYRMKRIGIPDVALLDRDTDKVVGLVEVLYTSKMSNTKINMLNKSEIPWVETKAEDVMGWTGADPLIAYRSSEPDWQCNACKDINWQHVTLERVAAIVDVYPKAGWSTKFYRKVFAIFQDIRALPNNAEELVDRYYLVEGTYMVLDGWNIIECESFLRGAVQFSESYEKIIGKEPIFLDGLHFALNEDQAMILLQDLMTTSLNTWKKSPTRYSIDDQALKWPGMSLRQIFHQKDSKGTLSKVVNVQNYQSLPTLYPTIARLFGYNIPWLKGNTSNSNKPLKKLVQK